ncbi:uncharacterized protein [Engystomops pustulosus]|uniref:uncharacterized protein n=1 Tax=Engystomops pustulosus TaxID=76066 RepID=UPI003AFB7667
MDLLEQFLTGDDENLCSYTMGELQNIVQLLSSEVQSQQEQLDKIKTEVQTLEADTTERSLGREFYVSRAAQAVDLQEALEVEERTQQQLQAVTHEMERLRASGSSESCESLNSRLTEVEDLLSTCCQQEKALQEEVEILKTSLEKSQAALEQTTAEHQAATSWILLDAGCVAGDLSQRKQRMAEPLHHWQNVRPRVTEQRDAPVQYSRAKSWCLLTREHQLPLN